MLSQKRNHNTKHQLHRSLIIQEHIKDLERELWDAADSLRGNLY